MSNREIVGHSCGDRHNTDLVLKAIMNSTYDAKKVRIFHSDRGGEFKGEQFCKYLSENNILHSLSKVVTPHDNSPSENLFKIFKTEWMNDCYNNLVEFTIHVESFVKWYNYFRFHSYVGNQSPVEARLKSS